jgi:hypothetical protein
MANKHANDCKESSIVGDRNGSEMLQRAVSFGMQRNIITSTHKDAIRFVDPDCPEMVR